MQSWDRVTMLPLLRTYALGLFSALQLLQQKGLVHTDIKLGNTAMVNGKVILLDFGALESSNLATVNNVVGRSLSKRLHPHSGTTSFRALETVIGSNFVAPGMYAAQKYKKKHCTVHKCFVILSGQDIYAAGILILALIIGQYSVYHVRCAEGEDANLSLVEKMSKYYGTQQMIYAFSKIGMILLMYTEQPSIDSF